MKKKLEYSSFYVYVVDNSHILHKLIRHYNIIFNENIDDSIIVSKIRRRDIAEARIIISNYLLRIKQLRITRVGRLLNRSHATIIYHKKLVDETPYFKKKYIKFSQNILKNYEVTTR